MASTNINTTTGTSGAAAAQASPSPQTGHHRQVLTAERVPLTLPLAGVGERAIATMVDALVVLLIVITALFGYSIFGRGDLEKDLSSASTTLMIFIAVSSVSSIVLYDVVADVFFNGRTPGKRVAKLRVVDAQGQAPDLLTSLLRNLMRLVDMLPIGYGVGFITIFFTGTKRLGDLVAGTMVISERSRGQRPLQLVADAAGLLDKRGQLRSTDTDDAVDGGATTNDGWPHLDDESILVAIDVIMRTVGLERTLGDQLVKAALPSLAVTGGTSTAGAAALKAIRTHTSPRQALALAIWMRRRDPASVVSRLAGLDAGEDAVAAAIAALEARRTSKNRLSANDVDTFDGILRQGASTLLSATRRGVPPRLLEALSLRLLEAERLRQPPPSPPWQRLRRYLAVDVPVAVYEERALVGRAAVILFGAGAVGFLGSYLNLEVGRSLIGDELMGLVEGGANWTNQIEASGSYVQASLNIIINNVGVGIRVFALGILGGVATILGLVFNGLSLGATFGVATRLGTADTLAQFILAHGPVELSMICVAGAAGLLLGKAVVSPGERRRLDAIRLAGGRGARLLTFATVGFLTIGMVEGFVSPGAHFSVVANAAVGIGMWLLFAGWARSGRGPARLATR